MLSWLEILLVSLIAIPGFAMLFRAWRGSPEELFSPRVFFVLMMLYYAAVGPLMYLLNQDAYILGVNVRPILWKGWLASAVAFAAFLAGYSLRAKRARLLKVRTDDRAVQKVSVVFFLIAAYGIVHWVIFYGGGWAFLSPVLTDEAAFLAESRLDNIGSVYLLQFINLSFGGVALLLIFAMERRSSFTTLLFLAVTLFAVLFFLKTGFRYRLAWLAVGLVASYFLWSGKRPRLWLWGCVVVAFVTIMGFIGLTRNYFGGISVAKAEDAGLVDYFFNGFAEAGTFLFVSQVVDRVPRDLPHTFFDPVWIALTSPIPRSLWSEKPTSATLDTMAAAFGSKDAYEAGMAVPYFGEWYIAFGWAGIVVSSLLFGLAARYLWEWYLGHDRDKFALVIYAVGLGFMYVAFSRGHLAQTVLNFCFSLLPLVFIYRFLPRKRLVAAQARAGAPSMPPESSSRPLERPAGFRRK